MGYNTINGDRTNQILDNLASTILNNSNTYNNSNVNTSLGAPVANNGDEVNQILDRLAQRLGLNATDTAQPQPAVKPKKKKKRGFFSRLKSKIGGVFKKIGGFLKKALPIASLLANFIPGVGPLVSMGLKVASAAMSAYNAVKNGNIMGAITSIAGAFTGGLSGLASKAQSFLGNTGLGNLVSRGIDFFNKGKEWLSNATAGIGGKITNWFANRGPAFLRDYATNIGNSVTNWLNNRVSSLFERFNSNPFVQRARDFFENGIGKNILDFFIGKSV